MSEIINFFDRDERGLVKGVEYKFLDDGRVNWRAMLKPEHLYVAKDKVPAIEKKYGKSLNELNKLDLADYELAILLSGIRYLANLRGFINVNQKVNNVTFDNHYNLVSSCTVTCTITWLPNFETYNREVAYSDVAGASLGSLEDFVKRYPESMAANRAFQRSVRNFLGISIVAKDECGPQEPLVLKEQERAQVGHEPKDLLEAHMKSMGLNFQKLKDNIIKKYLLNIKNSDPIQWQSINDIPKNDIFTIIGILSKATEKS